VPRKRYDDEALRARALELRRQGHSYREIARALGCSVYKVHELLAPLENPRSRLKQVAELAGKVEELERRVGELDSVLRGAGVLAEELERLSHELSELVREVELIRVSARMRTESRPCRYIDGRGYCTIWHWSSRTEGWDMEPLQDPSGGRVRYRLNVKKHPLICLACPLYTPQTRPGAQA